MTTTTKVSASMHDRHVRKALRDKVFKEHQEDENTLVLDELGLRHGACRVDIAVVNGYIHGYEIKSDADTLMRLPNQTSIYSAVLDRATLVVSEKHADKAVEIVPNWWGIKIVTMGPRGGIDFQQFRRATLNPEIDPVALAELLWHSEAAEILRELGVPSSLLRKPRAFLYCQLAEMLDLDELRPIVRQKLKGREKWRGLAPLSSSGGLSKPKPKL